MEIPETGEGELPLSREMIDQIIFAMENQSEVFVIDLERGMVLPASETEETLSVPPWTPADGYRLMERFVLTLKNPLYREALKSCLGAGHGVFRKFKDTLKQRPDIERLWYHFKRKEMQRIIYEWLERELDAEAAALLGPVPEETDDLILDDFLFLPLDSSCLEYIRIRDWSAFWEMHGKENGEHYVKALFQARNRAWGAFPAEEELPDENLVGFYAVTPAGEHAGMVWGRIILPEDVSHSFCVIQNLFVEPEYRGLGLASHLLSSFREEAEKRGLVRINIELPSPVSFLRSLLERSGFQPESSGFSCSF